MADHEDHNYYTRSNRESQIPDYDVNLSEPSDNLLPSFAYRRQSRDFSPKRPTVSTIFDQKSLESRSTRAEDSFTSSSHPDSSQDPHEFYRQYRESFQRRPESVYGQLDITAQTMVGRDSLTAVRQQRSPVSNRINGYNPSPVSARWNKSLENRKTPSPMSEKTSSRQHNAMPRAKGDIQALVNKFNSVRDDPSTSTAKPTIRSSSATHLTASNNFPTPTSFKSRASVDARSNISALGTRPTRDSVTGKLGGGGSGGNIQASGRARRPSQIASSTLASQSMTNLSPGGTTTLRQPLFGEVLQDGPIMSDPGFGIPAGRRRGSEGSLQRSSTIFQDVDKPILTVTAEPSSPSAWYKMETPSLNGIDLNRPLPSKKTGMHRRSRSDFGLIPLNLVSHSASASKPVSILSPPQELPTPSPNSRSYSPQRSRIPVSSRRTSITSDSGNSSGHHTPTRAIIGLPSSVRPLRSPEHGPGMRTPRRSTRYRNPSPPRQSSPKLDVHIADSSAPLKSPPLRSSRPRISVADASTAASRARRHNSHEETTNNRPPSKITNLPPNANMEQRRQMIRRDFTKSWHEKEEMHKRQSVYMQGLDELPIPDVPSPGKSKTQTPSEPMHSSSENIDVFTTPAENNSPKLELTIPMQDSSKPVIDHFANGDSPTLGTADFLPVARRPAEASEPASAVTEDTIDTFFEQNSEGSDSHHDQSEYGVVESSTTPRIGLLSPRSEFDDAESIQIMLGESPALDNRFQSSVEQLRSAVQRVPTPRSQAEQAPSIDQYKVAVQVQSVPANTADHADIPLASNVYATISANQDRESGGSIDALLETYQESEPRRLFSQSPGLARAGGWDNAKVTRMYLQSRSRKTPEPEGIVPPSVFQAEEDNDILQPAKMDIASAQILPRSRSPRIEQTPPQDTIPEASPQPSLDVPNSAKDHRASLSRRDDFVDTSPSMLDWMHNHQPAEEPTIETTGLRANATDNFLPDIPGGGLGIIDMKLEGAAELPSEMPADNNFISELHSSPQRRKDSSTDLTRINELDGSPTRRAEMSALGTTPPRKPVPVKSSKSLQSIMDMKPLPEVSAVKIKKGLNTAINGTIQGKRPSIPSDSTTKVNGSSADLPQDEQSKRLRRRLNIIKELVDTESTYGQDMTVVVDIYKGTCNVVLNSAQDERALFINAPEIVAFSTVFLDALKGAAKSVYVLPKSKRWRSKRDSAATQESSAEDQSSLYGHDLSDEERDRLTNIGSAFLDHLPEMERCYTEFLKNSEAANAKLKALQEDEKVKVWLDECCAYAKDLTTAWSLDSLLVKPLQRITKYPLLLRELCDVTPENHPDFVKLDTAAREISGVSKRINDAKRRMEMVEKVSQAEKKKSKDESRLNLQKAFGRRSDRYKTQVGLQEQFQDREYNQISDKFGTHFFKLQIVMRDVEMYIVDVQSWVNKFNSVTITMEDYFNIGSTTYPEIESKWRRFRSSIKDIHNTALVDHVNAVRKFVVDPMTTLLKLHDGPQRLMDKRKKRVPDFVKYRLLKDRTEKVDKKTTESAELFLAVNDTLKDELPKLFEMTSRLVEACLNNFVQLQLQWQSVWKRKMIQAIELAEVPRSFADIVSDFSGDFRYTEAHVLSLGICNGSVIADGASFLPPISQTTTLVGDSRRPSMTTIESSGRIRAASTATSASIDPVRNRGYSGPSGLLGPSPMLPSPDLGRPTEGFGLSSHLSVNSPRQPAQGLRVRASSTASSRSPVTPETANFQLTPQTRQPQTFGRPSTATGRSYESMPTHNVDMSLQRSDIDNRYQIPRDTPAQPTHPIHPTPPSGGFRTSGIFNSAMPMSDSPLASSPVNDALASNDFNVLFLAASVYEFNIDRARREAGYPYLTYVAGEIFDVIAEKGELWLAKNQDDEKNQIGWIWNKHFAKLAS